MYFKGVVEIYFEILSQCDIICVIFWLVHLQLKIFLNNNESFFLQFLSPFAVNALAAGIETEGGKPDDITVLLATVSLWSDWSIPASHWSRGPQYWPLIGQHPPPSLATSSFNGSSDLPSLGDSGQWTLGDGFRSRIETTQHHNKEESRNIQRGEDSSWRTPLFMIRM